MEIWNYFRWIDLKNEILKIKWVNKYMIICGLRDWKIIRRRILHDFIVLGDF